MKKIVDGMYVHRGVWIHTDEQGIWVEGWEHLFKTYNDARNFIDKIHDGSNKKEPVIIGKWDMHKAGY